MEIQQKIEQFIIQEILAVGTRANIDPDEPLIDSGILDSLGILRLITYLEDHMGLTIGDGDVVSQNFQTIRKISNFVSDRVAKSEGTAPSI